MFCIVQYSLKQHLRTHTCDPSPQNLQTLWVTTWVNHSCICRREEEDHGTRETPVWVNPEGRIQKTVFVQQSRQQPPQTRICVDWIRVKGVKGQNVPSCATRSLETLCDKKPKKTRFEALPKLGDGPDNGTPVPRKCRRFHPQPLPKVGSPCYRRCRREPVEGEDVERRRGFI